jgi:hypothetical protein
MNPQAFLARLSAARQRPGSGSFDHMQGMAVLGVTFETGHVLALRHVEHTSTGPGFTAVCMREPGGDWRFFSTNPPASSCARYMLPEVADQVPIDIRWVDDCTLHVSIRDISLRWFVRFEETRTLSAVVSRLPKAFLRSAAGSAVAAAVARSFLRPGNLRLHGELPNGQRFRGLPAQIWRVSHSTARVSSFDFGHVVRTEKQARFGDFWVPASPIAIGGVVEFQPLPARLPAGGEMAAAA